MDNRMKKGNNYPLDMEGGAKPLQLRRGSDAEARRSLIEKYHGDINDNDTLYNSHAPKGGVASGNESSMLRLDEEIKSTRGRKIKIAIIVGVVLAVAITLILIFTLKKKHPHPHPQPDPQLPEWVVNPYTIADMTDTGVRSFRVYNLSRNATNEANYSSVYAKRTLDNWHIEAASMKTSVIGSFNAMRVQFLDQNSSNNQY